MNSCCRMFDHCIHGNGRVMSETRDCYYFEDLVNEGDFNVYFTKGDQFSLVVEAEENLLKYIDTEFHGNTLYIENDHRRCLDCSYPMNIYITAPDVYSLKLTGSGLIHSNNLAVPELDLELTGSGNIDLFLETEHVNVNLTGSGDVILAGYSNSSDYILTGSGEINSFSMEQETSIMDVIGSGDIYVNAGEMIDVKIVGSGDVHYMGNPQIYSTILGTGKLRKWD